MDRLVELLELSTHANCPVSVKRSGVSVSRLVYTDPFPVVSTLSRPRNFSFYTHTHTNVLRWHNNVVSLSPRWLRDDMPARLGQGGPVDGTAT